MALHIRLVTNYFTHIKTIRLVSKIGNDAYWIMPRLWCYAAEHQPDGDFSKYSPKDIATGIQYQGNATSMLKAIMDVRFMDKDRKLHNWELHNAYHQTFTIRAKKAAKIRWDKQRNEREIEKETEREKEREQASDVVMPKHARSINHKPIYEKRFEEFWSSYPKKVGKNYAHQIWMKLLPDDKLHHQIIQAVEAGKKSRQWQKDQGQFIPHPSTWLNRHGWDDVYDQKRSFWEGVKLEGSHG